jgi:zinc/manganese transport system substrate-binding protein
MRVILSLMGALLSLAAAAEAKIRVAASLPDLASIASSVGGDQVEAFSIAKPNANPHSVEVLPSYMIKVSRAAVYLKVGLGLDGWADALIEGSRNGGLLVVDCSAGIAVLDKPAGKVDASLGDVHPDGNPHYWLDPANAGRIAAAIRDALKKADPAHAGGFDRNAEAFLAANAEKAQAWAARMGPLRGNAIVTYHSSWAYLAHAYGLRIVGYVEPFPGIPPTARHLAGLVEKAKAEKAGLLLLEPYFPDKDARFLERTAGLRLVKASPSCDGPAAGAYWAHLDAVVASLLGGGP